MFCAKCGKELPENAAFCPECGSKQEIKEKKKLDLSFIQNLPQKTKLIAICAAAALVLVLIITLCFSGSNVNKSPETVAGAFFESIFEMDVEKMVDCMADPIFNYLVRDMGLPETVSKSDAIDYMQRAFDLQANVIFEQFKYREINSVDLINSLDVEDLRQFGASEFEMREITSAVRVAVRFQKPNGGTHSVRVVCVEIDGDWYIWDLDI